MHLIEDESKLREIIQEKSMTAVLFSDAACNVCLSIYPELEALEKVYPEMYFVTGGVADYPEKADSAEKLISHADRALYAGCKSKGRNKIAIYEV